MLFVQTLHGPHTPLMPERKKQGVASRLVAKLPASVYYRPIGLKRAIPLCHSAAFFFIKNQNTLSMLYCSSVCALSVLCDKLFTVARYARFEKKASEIVCMSCLQQERYQLRCGSLQGGETTNADVPKSCSHETDGGSTIGR